MPAITDPAHDPLREFAATFIAFFRKRDIWLILGFILTFRLGESQLLKLAAPFLKDPVAAGGLGLSTAEIGIAYSTVGVIALTLGGLAGGCRHRPLWPETLPVADGVRDPHT